MHLAELFIWLAGQLLLIVVVFGTFYDLFVIRFSFMSFVRPQRYCDTFHCVSNNKD